jgi:hypothetical protein
LPNTPAQAAHILGAWALGSALVFIVIGSLQGKVAISRPRLPRLSTRARAPIGSAAGLSRFTMTLRSELFVLLRWPAVRALLLCLVVYTWLITYLDDP